LPRDSAQQAGIGKKVEEFAKSEPGDLAFFKDKLGKIAHVGIILEDGSIIHASGFVKIDTISEKGIMDGNTERTTHNLLKIKRVLKHHE